MDNPRLFPAQAETDLADVPESPIQGECSRAIVARCTSYPAGHHIQPHWHARAQFIFALTGTMRVRTPRRAWIVPPSRALWVPSHTVHEIQMYGEVEMRSLYRGQRGRRRHAVDVRGARRHGRCCASLSCARRIGGALRRGRR